MSRITDEQKLQINELYYDNHNKTLTAKLLGISVASVNRYLIDNYKPLNCKIKENKSFESKPQGISKEILSLNGKENFIAALIQLSPSEWEDLNNLQKGISL